MNRVGLQIAAFVIAGVALPAVAQTDPGRASSGQTVRVARDSAADRVVSMEYEGRFSYVRIERREPGSEANQHPVAIEVTAMRSLLASLQLPGRKTEPLLTSTELDEISAPVASALRKATADQDVTFAVSDRHGLLGPLAARAVTTARVFRRDGQLQVIAGMVRHDFESQFRATGYVIPFEPGSRAKAVEPDARISVEAGAGNNRRPDWAVLWLDAKPAAPATVAAPAAVPSAAPAAPSTTASPATTPAAAAVVPAARPGSAPEVAPGAPPDSDTIYRNVSERLKALQRLRDTGLITEPEYQEKRRQILKDM
jgi:hypothetical protein